MPTPFNLWTQLQINQDYNLGLISQDIIHVFAHTGNGELTDNLIAKEFTGEFNREITAGVTAPFVEQSISLEVINVVSITAQVTAPFVEQSITLTSLGTITAQVTAPFVEQNIELHQLIFVQSTVTSPFVDNFVNLSSILNITNGLIAPFCESSVNLSSIVHVNANNIAPFVEQNIILELESLALEVTAQVTAPFVTQHVHLLLGEQEGITGVYGSIGSVVVPGSTAFPISYGAISQSVRGNISGN